MKLRDFRESRGLKQIDMAAAVGVAPGVLCSVESGKRFPEPATMLKIMRFSVDAATGLPAVTPNDMVETWCAAHGEPYPGAATFARNGKVSSRAANEAKPGDPKWRVKNQAAKASAGPAVAGARAKRKTTR